MVGSPPGEGDRDFLRMLLADPRVGETLGGVRTAEESDAMLQRERERWARDGFGFLIWRERSTGEPIARGGLARTVIEGEDVVEVGWAVRSDRWGEGFATELGAASLGAASRLGLREVVAFALPHNRASRRVMEKLGMVYDRTFVHGQWGLHVLYVTTPR
jgi:RimJ/RimL family protein N-acetyltransferase